VAVGRCPASPGPARRAGSPVAFAQWHNPPLRRIREFPLDGENLTLLKAHQQRTFRLRALVTEVFS